MVRLPFRRTQTDEQDSVKMPKEVVDYYQAEKRDRRGLTWLLGFATMIVTILVVFGLYYGGRWAYRSITGRDNQQTATTQEPSQQDSDDTNVPGANNQDNVKKDSNTPNNQATDESASPSSDNAQGKTPVASSSDATGDLPGTGPGNIAAVFAATSGIGAVAHYVVSKRRD